MNLEYYRLSSGKYCIKALIPENSKKIEILSPLAISRKLGIETSRIAEIYTVNNAVINSSFGLAIPVFYNKIDAISAIESIKDIVNFRN